MSTVPPPKASPQVPRDEEDAPVEPQTGEFPAAVGTYVKTRVAKVKTRGDRQTIAVVVAALLGSGPGYLSVRAIAQDAGHAEVKVVSEKEKLDAAEIAAMKVEYAAKFERIDKRFDHQDEKQDLVLDALRVPLWKRPEPVPPAPAKDGGR